MSDPAAPVNDAGGLAIICGGGTLPFALADAAKRRGRHVVLFPLRPWADPQLVAAYPHHWCSIGQWKRFMRIAAAEGCREVTFIGQLTRPSLWKVRPDLLALRLIPQVLRLYRGGDEYLLSGLGRMLERFGFRLVAPADIAPELLVKRGLLTGREPTEQDRADIARGLAFLDAISPFDVGQAVVVANNQVLAVEGPENTDQTLMRVAELRRSGRIRSPVGSGVLVKAPKLGQDRRIDLPAIGPPTVEKVSAAGLGGIAVAAGATLVAEPERLAAAAARAGIFVIGVDVRRARSMTAIAPRAPAGGSGGLHVFLVAVEESGDRLGVALMRALRERSAAPVEFSGVGGREMEAAGLTSLFPADDFGIIGFAAIPRRLPRILRHMAQIVRAVLARPPDVLVAIDSPAFSLRVARRVRRANASIPIVDYVSPSVWAWRPGRAKSMRDYVDHVVALLPFEPEVHHRLGGPPCTYVGHPLSEEASQFRPNEAEAKRRLSDPPVVLAMIGSRSSEVKWMAADFGKALALASERFGPLDVVVPTVPHLVDQVRRATSDWAVRPRVVVDKTEKLAAIRNARAALAKSGTTTLELAVAGVPMVAAYKASAIEAKAVRLLVRVHSYILANLVIGENVVPELMQDDCNPQALANALVPLLRDTPERRRQVEAFARLDAIMEIGARSPAGRAADIVLDLARTGVAKK